MPPAEEVDGMVDGQQASGGDRSFEPIVRRLAEVDPRNLTEGIGMALVGGDLLTGINWSP